MMAARGHFRARQKHHRASVLQPRQQVEFESVFDRCAEIRGCDVRGDLTLPDASRTQDGLARLRRM